MASYFELKEKQKKALIAVCTLGLSAAPWGILFSSSSDVDKGMSFQGTPAGFIFKIFWFFAMSLLTLAIIWIINIFKLIYYSIVLSKYQENLTRHKSSVLYINKIGVHFKIGTSSFREPPLPFPKESFRVRRGGQRVR